MDLRWRARRAEPGPRANDSGLDPRLRSEIVHFLRDWLPSQAIESYREMILADRTGWWDHPHFAGGIIVDGALRGNGITEQVLGVRSLDALWPRLLEEAVLAEVEEPPQGRVAGSDDR